MSKPEDPRPEDKTPEATSTPRTQAEEEGRRTLLIAAVIVSIVALGYIAVLLAGGRALRGLPFAEQIQEAGKAIGEVVGGRGPAVQLPPLRSEEEVAAEQSPTPVVPRASVSPTVIPPEPDAPSTVTFTIEYENTTGVRLTGVRITNELPAGSAFKSANPSGSFDGKQLVWDIGTLDPGQKGSVSFQVATNRKGRITNKAVMSSNEAPSSTIESSATVS